MRSENKGFPPIPFEDSILEASYRLKRLGLPWRPQVGCFVWDREKIINAPSPFPKRVYFILNLQRFLAIFETIEKMGQKLVWIPTWHQAVQLCRLLGVQDPVKTARENASLSYSAENSLLEIYERIARKLEENVDRYSTHTETAIIDSSEEAQWIERLMEKEVGNFRDLPQEASSRIQRVYSEAAKAYLGWRRIMERKGDDWIPSEKVMEPETVADLSHFFSDCQHLMKSVHRIRQLVERLRSVDSSKDPERYSRLIRQISEEDFERSEGEKLMDSLISR